MYINVNIYLMLLCSFVSCASPKKPVMWKKTIGILYARSGPNGNAQIVYHDDSSNYYYGDFQPRHDDAVDGEIYTMRYNSNNPKEIDVDYWHPIFLPQENTKFTEATISKIHHKNLVDPSPFIVFTYFVDNVKFRTMAYLPPNFEEKYPELKEGNVYKLEYLESNIHRIAILLDQRVK